MDKFIMNPGVPTTGPARLRTIISIMQIIHKILKDKSEETNKLKNTNSINDKSSAEDIDYIMQALTHFQERVNEQIKEIEKIYIEEINTYFNELGEILNEKQKCFDKYGINKNRIGRKIDRILEKSRGALKKEVSRRISLDNMELRNVLKMIPGIKKERALQDFYSNILQQAIYESCEEMKRDLSDIFEEVDDEVLGTIDRVKMNCQEQEKKLKEIDMDNSTEKMKLIICEAYYKTFVCDKITSILMEG